MLKTCKTARTRMGWPHNDVIYGCQEQNNVTRRTDAGRT